VLEWRDAFPSARICSRGYKIGKISASTDEQNLDDVLAALG